MTLLEVSAFITAVGAILLAIWLPRQAAQAADRKQTLTAQLHAAEKEQDWAREDAVAARALAASARQEALLRESNKVQVEVASKTLGKLEDIHTLVNSQMTAAMQAELEATVAERASLMELRDIKLATGGNTETPVADAAIAALDVRIGALRVSIADRMKAAEVVSDRAETIVTGEGSTT